MERAPPCRGLRIGTRVLVVGRAARQIAIDVMHQADIGVEHHARVAAIGSPPGRPVLIIASHVPRSPGIEINFFVVLFVEYLRTYDS